MGTIVTLEDQNGAVLKRVKMEESAEVANLLPLLISLLSLPITDDAGRPIKYHLSYRNTRLNDNQTLAEAEVRNGDSLVIIADMIAGAHFEANDLEPPEPLVVLEPTPITDGYRPQPGFPPTYRADARTETVLVAFQEGIMPSIFAQARGRQEEIGGILLGNVYAQEQSLLVVVEQMLEAKHTFAGPAYLMFTGDTGQDLLQRRATAALPVVGWYHSHPGFGIFLSSSDQFIQRNFFSNRPWYIALVVDPTSEDWGVFAWERQHIKRCINISAQTIR